MVLDKIIERKREEVAASKRRLPFEKIVKMAGKKKFKKRSLFKALRGEGLHLICELKKASPSKGILRRQFKPLSLAQEFESAGASAISVLTEKHFFKGDPKTLNQIRPHTKVPLLRKDFILEPYQIYETLLLGADVFLIIVTLVSDTELRNMLRIAKTLNLEVLVEVHTKDELKRALAAGSKIIGINNRNLKTLHVDFSVSRRLIKQIPKGIVAVIESGVGNKNDILRYQRLGAHNFLIGTVLMKSRNVSKKINELSEKAESINATG